MQFRFLWTFQVARCFSTEKHDRKRTGWRQCEKGEVHTRCATRPPDLPAVPSGLLRPPRALGRRQSKSRQTKRRPKFRRNQTTQTASHTTDEGQFLPSHNRHLSRFPIKSPTSRADLHAQTRIQTIQLPIGSNPHVSTPTLHCAILSKCRTPPICIGLSIADLVPGPRKTDWRKPSHASTRFWPSAAHPPCRLPSSRTAGHGPIMSASATWTAVSNSMIRHGTI